MTETLSNEVWVNEMETIKNMQQKTEGKRTQKWKGGVEEVVVLVLTTQVTQSLGKILTLSALPQTSFIMLAKLLSIC